MRTIGVTAGATEPARAIVPRLSILQAIAHTDVPRIVLHLVDDAVIFGGRHCDRGFGIGLAERSERLFARLEGFDHAIETR
jgi:hypothetical protein